MGDFTYERRTFLGRPKDEFVDQESASSPTRNRAGLDSELPPCIAAGLPESGAVEIRRTEIWRPKAGAHTLTRQSISVQRVEHAASDDFPFGLPIRDQKFFTGVTKIGVCRASDDTRSVPSPDGRLRAVTSTDRSVSYPSLRLVDLKQRIRRTIRFHHYVAGTPLAVGWSADSRRVYAVVGFGEDERALLSFSVVGKDDYWEQLLPGDRLRWEDGFVVSPQIQHR